MPKNYHLYLKGRVGAWNFNADMTNYVLDKHKDEQVSVLIDSLGGDVATALSISSLFQMHGNVHCHYVGMNASAATIAAMGAKHITIDADALFLVHKCMQLVFEWDWLNADELEAHIKELEKMKEDGDTIDGCIAGMYAKRCKKTKDELLDLMKKGAWLTAKQALEWGFVDEITNQAEDEKPEMDAAVASFLEASGIPMPPMQIKKDSFLERVFKSLFPSKPAAEGEEPTPAQQPQPMAKEFASIAAVLGSALAVDEKGLYHLTEQQADALEQTIADKAALNATIASKDEVIASKDAEIKELNAKIADLMKEPATPTTDVTENSKDEKPFIDADLQKYVDALYQNV